MRIISIFHGRFPSEKAAGLFAAQEADSFAKIGIETELIVPNRKGRERQNAHSYYGMSPDVKVTYLKTVDLYSTALKKIAFYVSLCAFSAAVLLYLKRNSSKDDIVYSNETLPLIAASWAGRNVVYAVHDFPEKKKWFYSYLIRRASGILVTNLWKKDKLISEFGISAEKMLVQPNAVDVEKFSISISQEEARTKLHLPQDVDIVVYTGHLYSWKGAHTLAEAASRLPDKMHVYFVGGTEDDIQRFRDMYGKRENIHFAGFRLHDEIPLWQKAADVLVLPNSGKEEISVHYTSPMKLFEYMASGTPIVASNLPSIRSIVDEDSAYFFTPDDPESLAHQLEIVLELGGGVSKKARNAAQDVMQYSWEERAGSMLSFIKRKYK